MSSAESCTGTVRELAGGDARATGQEADGAAQDVQVYTQAPAVIPLKRPEGRAPGSGVEAAVRVLGALGKCVSGIRRGDQNRVRLAQADRKLAQRDKIIALERRKYNDERAEVRARKKAEEKLKKAKEKKRKNASRLSPATQIDLLRHGLFGHGEHIIAEKEAHIKQEQKELAELRRELGVSGGSSDAGGTKDGGELKVPSSKFQIPNSKGSIATAESAVEQVRVHVSTSDRLEENGTAAEAAGGNFSTQTGR